MLLVSPRLQMLCCCQCCRVMCATIVPGASGHNHSCYYGNQGLGCSPYCLDSWGCGYCHHGVVPGLWALPWFLVPQVIGTAATKASKFLDAALLLGKAEVAVTTTDGGGNGSKVPLWFLEPPVMGSANAVPLVPSPSWGPICPPSDVWSLGYSGAENPVLSYGCPTDCNLKARNKGNDSLLHDTDITLGNKIFKHILMETYSIFFYL